MHEVTHMLYNECPIQNRAQHWLRINLRLFSSFYEIENEKDGKNTLQQLMTLLNKQDLAAKIFPTLFLVVTSMQSGCGA